MYETGNREVRLRKRWPMAIAAGLLGAAVLCQPNSAHAFGFHGGGFHGGGFQGGGLPSPQTMFCCAMSQCRNDRCSSRRDGSAVRITD